LEFLSAKGKGKIAIFGAPYDSTTCFRPGARLAPDGIRLFSQNLEEYSPELNKSLENLEFKDLGNLELPAEPKKMVEELYSFVKGIEIPVALGGEHSITYPIVKALSERFKELTVVQFDAHADLREEYSGTPYSHACVMRRVLELGNTRLIQVGIRSGTGEEFNLIEKSGRITYVKDVKELPKALSDVKTPLYFTIDIDFFDPSFAPGTGTPEHCGALPVDFFKAVYKLPAAEVVGFDVVEISPPYDPSGITQALGAKLVRELLLKFWG